MMKVLNQALVTRYAKYQALKNLLDKWLDAQRLAFVAAFEAGASCPDRGPYLLELGSAEERVNWRQEFFDRLVNEGLTENDAQAAMDGISAIEREKKPRLYCKRNANYRREFPIRLPR